MAMDIREYLNDVNNGKIPSWRMDKFGKAFIYILQSNLMPTIFVVHYDRLAVIIQEFVITHNPIQARGAEKTPR